MVLTHLMQSLSLRHRGRRKTSIQHLPPELLWQIRDLMVEGDGRQAHLLGLSLSCKYLFEIFQPTLIPYNIKKCGSSGLHWAAAHNDLALPARPLCNYPEKHIREQLLHETPLWIAISRGHDEIAIFLLDNGANPHSKNWCDSNDVFQLAVTNNRVRVARKFLESDLIADSFQREFENRPLAWVAAGYKDLTMFELLLDDVRKRRPRLLAQLQEIALGRAVMDGSVERVQLLLDRGANVDCHIEGMAHGCKAMSAPWTPLYDSIYTGNRKLVKILLDHGARLDIDRLRLEDALCMTRRHDKKTEEAILLDVYNACHKLRTEDYERWRRTWGDIKRYCEYAWGEDTMSGKF